MVVRALSCAAVVLATLAAAPLALADGTVSTNWAGYAVHRAGVSFRSVAGEWRQPGARCRRGHATYSAMWVGIGGYALGSQALEQAGTELDCTLSGRAVSSAWWELLPAASQSIPMRVKPGDLMASRVTVSGHSARLELYDLTRHEQFVRTVSWPAIDTSSAEWIVEAPSECLTLDACQVLPLANFGTGTFNLASAQSAAGHRGTISDPAWRFTTITLAPHGSRRFVVYHGRGASAGAARPTGLRLGGSSFSVNFAQIAVQSNPFLTARAASSVGGSPWVPGGHLVH